MLERFFKTDSTPRRLRNGPAGPFLDGFAESMVAGGYSSRTVGPRDRHRVGAHAVARDAAGGVGGDEEGG